MNEFTVKIVVHNKPVENAVNLNCMQTEVDVTEIPLPRPLNGTLSKSWLAQKIAETLGELIVRECPQGPANSQPHLHYQVKHSVVYSDM